MKQSPLESKHPSQEKPYSCLSNSQSILRPAMAADERLSYSFSLVPVEIEKHLVENYSLEVGEEVTWNTEVLADKSGGDGILKALINVVDTLIQRIDDVGFDNNSMPYQRPE